MFRRRLFGVLVLIVLLGGVSVMASASHAGDILSFEGMYTTIEPVAVHSHVLKKSEGFTTIFHTSQGQFTRDLTVKDNSILTAGDKFPSFTITAPAGQLPELTLTDPKDSSQFAVFEFANRNSDWHIGGPTLFTTDMFLVNNTFKDLNFDPFRRNDSGGGGGIFAYDNAHGVSIDPVTNTVTIDAGATACFDVTAVPEPATALLAVVSGVVGLTCLWLTRRAVKRIA